MKTGRVLLGVAVFVLLVAALPFSASSKLKGWSYSALKPPLGFSGHAAQFFLDLLLFRRNANELRDSRKMLAAEKLDPNQQRELIAENERLTRLVELRRIMPVSLAERTLYARVIGRSPSAWNRAFLIDKGERDGLRVNAAVLTEQALIGKIVEAGPSVSKVLLLTDPNSRIGALLQRTRQHGVLFGTFSGECRMKYLSLDAEVQKGDIVESAGSGGVIPKGILVGQVIKVWKEPGQIYQVAQIQLSADLSRVEEVVCLV